jgi:hypothetical protein
VKELANIEGGEQEKVEVKTSTSSFPFQAGCLKLIQTEGEESNVK